MPPFTVLPKIELHLHLDCSLSYDVVHRLAPGITEERYRRDFIAPPRCRDLADYLTRALAQIHLMQSERALRLVTLDLFDQLAHDGVIYAEIRFAPLLHTAGGLSPETVVETVAGAMAEGSEETGIRAGLILCTLRHFDGEQSMQTARLAVHFRDRIAGFDIAGDEAGFPLDAHIPAFRLAAEHDIPLTAHAGEGRGPESVWETLRELAPRRIGHGVRSIEDVDLVAHLCEQGIHLETNPSSNVQTGISREIADHPLRPLYEAGVSVGISTDCRTITAVTLSEEYAQICDACGWGEGELLRCNLNALAAAFLPESGKGPLRETLLAAYQH